MQHEFIQSVSFPPLPAGVRTALIALLLTSVAHDAQAVHVDHRNDSPEQCVKMLDPVLDSVGSVKKLNIQKASVDKVSLHWGSQSCIFTPEALALAKFIGSAQYKKEEIQGLVANILSNADIPLAAVNSTSPTATNTDHIDTPIEPAVAVNKQASPFIPPRKPPPPSKQAVAVEIPMPTSTHPQDNSDLRPRVIPSQIPLPSAPRQNQDPVEDEATPYKDLSPLGQTFWQNIHCPNQPKQKNCAAWNTQQKVIKLNQKVGAREAAEKATKELWRNISFGMASALLLLFLSSRYLKWGHIPEKFKSTKKELEIQNLIKSLHDLRSDTAEKLATKLSTFGINLDDQTIWSGYWGLRKLKKEAENMLLNAKNEEDFDE